MRACGFSRRLSSRHARTIPAPDPLSGGPAGRRDRATYPPWWVASRCLKWQYVPLMPRKPVIASDESGYQGKNSSIGRKCRPRRDHPVPSPGAVECTTMPEGRHTMPHELHEEDCRRGRRLLRGRSPGLVVSPDREPGLDRHSPAATARALIGGAGAVPATGRPSPGWGARRPARRHHPPPGGPGEHSCRPAGRQRLGDSPDFVPASPYDFVSPGFSRGFGCPPFAITDLPRKVNGTDLII